MCLLSRRRRENIFGPDVTEAHDKRADLTRRQILRAAARQFAHRPYSQVSLDDILSDAAVTKGAMYFHFRSKYALALALIDEQTHKGRAAANDVLARRLSGLEALIEMSYQFAVLDLSDEMTRAGMNLTESVGMIDGLRSKLLSEWVDALAVILRQAIAEGDVRSEVKPDVAGRLLVSLHMGLRQISELSDSQRFFTDLEQIWLIVLAGLAEPDRIDYLTQFVRRRAAVAVNTVPLRPGEP